jgi:hypothetical protein
MLMTFVEFQVVFKRIKISSDVLVVAIQSSNTQPRSCSLKVKDIVGPDRTIKNDVGHILLNKLEFCSRFFHCLRNSTLI